MKYKVLFFFSVIILSSCANLEVYERVYVNDPEMEMGDDSAKNFQTYVTSIREGATPPTSAKSSGGCGCN